MHGHAPLYLEPRHPGLRVDVPHEAVKLDRVRRARLHLLVVVLRVLVVAHAHELLLLVRAREDERRDAEHVLRRDLARLRRAALELERVHARGHRPDEAVVELLVELLVARARDVDEPPFDVCGTKAA